MHIVIEKGTKLDVDQLAKLYDDLNDFLACNINYPGWRKGVYPTRKDAANAVASGTLYVAKSAEEIVGSIVLNHIPEPAYNKVKWNVDADYTSVFVVHTFAVHPTYLKSGVGTSLMNFAIHHCTNEHAKAIRLDVYENNTPAIRLYEKYGFTYVNKVDLGLGKYGLNHFYLYEKAL